MSMNSNLILSKEGLGFLKMESNLKLYFLPFSKHTESRVKTYGYL